MSNGRDAVPAEENRPETALATKCKGIGLYEETPVLAAGTPDVHIFQSNPDVTWFKPGINLRRMQNVQHVLVSPKTGCRLAGLAVWDAREDGSIAVEADSGASDARQLPASCPSTGHPPCAQLISSQRPSERHRLQPRAIGDKPAKRIPRRPPPRIPGNNHDPARRRLPPITEARPQRHPTSRFHQR